MDADEALRRLRAADPAADLDGVWPGSPADALAQERDVDAEPVRRWRPVLAAAAAAVVVAAVAVGTAWLHNNARSPQPVAAPTAPVTSDSSAPTDDPQQQTEALVAALLTAAPVLPGAESSATNPIPTLTGPATTTGSPNQIDYHRYWTAPGTVEAALAYLHSHPPDGLTLSGSESGGNSKTGEVGPQVLFFDAPDTSYARGVEMFVAVIADGDGVAVRADVQAIWIPVRDPATMLADVTSVDVTVTRQRSRGYPGAPTVIRTLDGADAQTVADAVNALPIDTPGVVHGCLAGFPGTTDELDFATRAGTVHVTDELTGCVGVQMQLTDGSKYGFEAGDLDATLMHVLGLPGNYGQ